MDIQRVKATVKKITRLLDQINDEASAIEKDLVLDYLREAYDLVLESNPALPKKDSTIGVPSTEIKPNIQPHREVSAPAAYDKPSATAQPHRETSTPTAPDEPSAITQPHREVPILKASDEPSATTQPHREVPNPATSDVNQPAVESSALLQLFLPLTAHDLSEKLSAQPIRNLKQAFSINDRLLFTNELFEKNAELFADTLKMVDNYESWEPAKSALLNLASQFHWEKGEKSEIAKQFIKTIQRKFT